MKIGVIGSGALGSLFGGYLSQSGHDVYLYDIWEEHVESINNDGLFIERLNDNDITCYPTATVDPSEVGVVDIAFVFVKSNHTKAAMEDAASMYDTDTVIVTLQNGLSNIDIIEKYVPQDSIVAGTTLIGANIKNPGHIFQDGLSGETKIGGDDSKHVSLINQLLSEAGLHTTPVDDPLPHIWDKQILSVGVKPIAGLTELKIGPISEYEPTSMILSALIEEAMEVAEAKGIEIITEDPIQEARNHCKQNPDVMSSMLEDILKQRPTEINHINGAIVDYGRELGVDTPYNEMATNLIKGKEQSFE